ncbi:MAG: adenylosuccinate lyase [Flavobacteriaceae bacterium]
MKLSPLNAISPIDGRYRGKIKSLSKYFSEEALIKYRVRVEIEYFIALCQIPLPQLEQINPIIYEDLRSIYKHFSEVDAMEIKEIEKTTNHDVKAVEYFIKNEFDKLDIGRYKEFIHFGLTSQDINNTAIPLSIKEAIQQIYIPHLEEVQEALSFLSKTYSNIPMLSRTHGQPASPTILGKEIAVFSKRLEVQKASLMQVPNAAKFSGATGNFNAHKVAYPDIDWKKFGEKFVEEQLELHYSFPTTQIEHYDSIAALCDSLKRINTIFIDFNKDVWTYISMDYFKQIINENEVGSSAMPHKINPIDFENAEGNLGIANALLNFFSTKLPISRLQRDLTDSTILRNIGVPFGHILIALKSMLNGIRKLNINQTKIDADLNENWSVVAEAIQTILRREKFPNPYETLKQLTRTNGVINKKVIHEFIENLEIEDQIKQELKEISPSNYTGIS